MEPRKAATETVELLKHALGDRLRAAVLYGSVVRGEYVQGVSDINLLLFLDDVDTSAILAAAPVAARMASARVNPLVMEWEERAPASDVFGIELLDMRDAHEVLHGLDSLHDLRVSRSALRLQAERELRSKLLHLHSAMLHARDDDTVIGQLLVAALPSFVTYLRAVLRLANQPVPPRMPEVIEAGCRCVGANPAGLLAAVEARLTGKAWKLDPENPNVEAYRAACERTARYVDTLPGE
jgi:predicted nucleotidyltransferase